MKAMYRTNFEFGDKQTPLALDVCSTCLFNSRYATAIPDQIPAGFNGTITTCAARIRAKTRESRIRGFRDTPLPKLLSDEIRSPITEKEADFHA